MKTSRFFQLQQTLEQKKRRAQQTGRCIHGAWVAGHGPAVRCSAVEFQEKRDVRQCWEFSSTLPKQAGDCPCNLLSPRTQQTRTSAKLGEGCEFVQSSMMSSTALVWSWHAASNASICTSGWCRGLSRGCHMAASSPIFHVPVARHAGRL